MGQFGDLLEAHSRDLIASLLKHEHWHLEAGELLGGADKLVSRIPRSSLRQRPQR